MLERDICRAAVKSILVKGKIIEEYLNDYPCPSVLIAEFVNKIPLHVVAAYDDFVDICYVITAYIPDEKHFENDFKTRKK